MFKARFAILSELEKLLEREASALSRGAMSEVLEELPGKERLLSELEDVSHQINAAQAQNPRLRTQLKRIQARIEANAARIGRLKIIAGDMARDLQTVRNRHGLTGLYGVDGGQSKAAVSQLQRLDREV